MIYSHTFMNICTVINFHFRSVILLSILWSCRRQMSISPQGLNRQAASVRHNCSGRKERTQMCLEIFSKIFPMLLKLCGVGTLYFFFKRSSNDNNVFDTHCHFILKVLKTFDCDTFNENHPSILTNNLSSCSIEGEKKVDERIVQYEMLGNRTT